MNNNNKEVALFAGGVLFGLSFLSLYRFLLNIFSNKKQLSTPLHISPVNNNNNNNNNNNTLRTNGDSNNSDNIIVINENIQNKLSGKITKRKEGEERGGEGGIEEFELGEWVKKGFKELVGNTPIIYLESLSRATGCIILVLPPFLLLPLIINC